MPSYPSGHVTVEFPSNGKRYGVSKLSVYQWVVLHHGKRYGAALAPPIGSKRK